MSAIVLDPSREVPLYFRANRNAVAQILSFTDAVGNPYTVSGKTWQLNIKKRKDDTANVLQLLSGTGLSIGSTTITISPTAAQTSIRAQEYYWELFNVTDSQTWICGTCYVHNGIFDGVANSISTTITITVTTFTNPMTTEGDIIVGGAAGTPTRVAAPAAGLVWTGNGVGVAPTYQAPAAGAPAWLLASGGTFTGANVIAQGANALSFTGSGGMTINSGNVTIGSGSNTWEYTASNGQLKDNGSYFVFNRIDGFGISSAGTSTIQVAGGGNVLILTTNNGNIQLNPGTSSVIVNGNLKLLGVAPAQTTNAQIIANTNNYAIGGATSFRISTDAARNITGLTGGVDGKILVIRNIGAFTITFTHEDAASTAANRVTASTAASISLLANGCLILQYDATASRWFDVALR